MYKLAEILPKIDIASLSEDIKENIEIIKTLSDNFTNSDPEALELDELTAPLIVVPSPVAPAESAVAQPEDKPEPEVKGTIFLGTKHKYPNQFVVNKAIEELLDSKDEFSSDEMEFISQYAGYGGLEKFGTLGEGRGKELLYEFFTPESIVKKMWALAIKYGYQGGAWMEPSCGNGRFIKFSPTPDLCTGYEINKYSAKICQLLYPKAVIKNANFETLFIKNNSSVKHKYFDVQAYDLIIGNPPYGDLQGKYMGMGEKDYTQAHNFAEYFITRGLDLLMPGGLLVYIVGAELKNGGRLFLDAAETPCKKAIAEKSDLLDAYRLPAGLFDNTGVTTEIIVFKKKDNQ
jgi:hypothetical protein